MAEYMGDSDIDDDTVDMHIVDCEESEESDFLCNVPTQNRFDGVRSGRGNGWTQCRKRKKVSTGSTDTTENDTHALSELSNNDKFLRLHDVVTENNSMLNEMRREQTQYFRTTEELQACVISLTERSERAERIVDKQSECLKMLTYRSIDMEARSRRNNIILYGISERPNINIHQLVFNFIEDELEVDTTNMMIERAHRLGSRSNQGRHTEDPKRPIIVRFRDYIDTEVIMRHAYRLKGSPFGIDRDYPREIATARKQLYLSQEAKDARQNRKKVQIVYPAKLVIDGRLRQDRFPEWQKYMRMDRVETITFDNFQRESQLEKPVIATDSACDNVLYSVTSVNCAKSVNSAKVVDSSNGERSSTVVPVRVSKISADKSTTGKQTTRGHMDTHTHTSSAPSRSRDRSPSRERINRRKNSPVISGSRGRRRERVQHSTNIDQRRQDKTNIQTRDSQYQSRRQDNTQNNNNGCAKNRTGVSQVVNGSDKPVTSTRL